MSADTPVAECVSVFIADATPFECQLLADSLSRSHFRIIGWASDADAVIAGILTQEPDIALLSLRLQGGELDGLRILGELSSKCPRTRIVMLLDDCDPAFVVEAFRTGASGIFSRALGFHGLRKCIRCVLAGQIWAGHKEMAYLIEALRRSPSRHITNANGVSLLTKREEEVVALAVDGLTNRDIAKHLGLSQHTIKNYLFEIFEKLGVSTRVELVLYALYHQSSALDQLNDGDKNGSANLTA